MKFTTPLRLPDYPFQLTTDSKVVSLGSCFAENMGQRLTDHGVRSMVQPFGAIYHPLALSTLLAGGSALDELLPTTLVQREGLWVSHLAHSDIHAAAPEDLVNKLSSRVALVRRELQGADVLILTWGTANAHRLLGAEWVVANRHKQPGQGFESHRSTVEQLLGPWQALLASLLKDNPRLHVILSVSPVRHVAEGLAGNSLSKSLLRVFSDQLASSHDRAHYFPAYELLVDELRDYRWYGQDLVHPSEQAVELVWQRFAEAVVAPDSWPHLQAYRQVVRDLDHKPFHPRSEAYRSHLQATLQKAKDLRPVMDTRPLIRTLEERIGRFEK